MATTLIEKSIKAWSSYLIQESSVKTRSKLCRAILCVEPAVTQNCVPLIQTEEGETPTKSMDSIPF